LQQEEILSEVDVDLLEQIMAQYEQKVSSARVDLQSVRC
jgi:hypothetical protein